MGIDLVFSLKIEILVDRDIQFFIKLEIHPVEFLHLDFLLYVKRLHGYTAICSKEPRITLTDTCSAHPIGITVVQGCAHLFTYLTEPRFMASERLVLMHVVQH